MRRLLRSWPLTGQREFFERDLGIPLKLEEDSGKYFPVSDRARDVRDALVSAARAAGVEIRFSSAVTALRMAAGSTPKEALWHVETTSAPIETAAVILASGGRSVPTTGSDGALLDTVRALGHAVHPTYPALTPLVADPPVHAGLAGISLAVRIRAKWQRSEAEAHGGFLFTHRGYSGPSVLDVSHVAVQSLAAGKERAALRVRWSELDRDAWLAILDAHGGLVLSAVSRTLPGRLAERLISESGVPLDRRASELRKAERNGLLDRLTSYELPWSGDEGFKKAEVTGGGVALDEVDTRTLESRRCPGLFLCGEILDAFGPIGGHNFAWAWATGRLAGTAAAETHNSQLTTRN